MHPSWRLHAAVAALFLAFPLWAGEEWPALRHAAKPFDSTVAAVPFPDHDRVLLQSPYSPGVLVRMKTRRMTLFAGLDAYGAEPPTRFWVRTAEGVKTLRRGESIPGEAMTASWIVASFQGARGWEEFDAPWFLSLERRPATVALSENGLTLTMPEADTGHVFSMPLFGYDKPPQQHSRFAESHGLPSTGVEPWTWDAAFPKAIADRCDWWASVAKAYPAGFQEVFRVDPAEDRVDFRQQYRWLMIEDDWKTEPRRFATLPPSVALARVEEGFPLEVSGPVHDPGYWTAYGPMAGVVDVDSFEYSLHVLQYLHDVEMVRTDGPRSAAGALALDKIKAAMEQKFPTAWTYRFDHGDRANLCWNIVGDVWYGRALALVDPALRGRATESMRVYMSDEILTPHDPYHGKYLLHGPGIGSWGEWGDAAKFMTNALQPIWAYAAFGEDWELIRERWDLIKRFFSTPEQADWLSFGRYAIAEIGDEAAPCSAYARLALGVGDLDEYLFGAYMFSRELVHLYIKQTAGRQFYSHQPYHSTDPMPERIYPTDMWGSTVGWQVDGPYWGHLSSGEHQSANRWVRFQDPDVGRFYRDRLNQKVGAELDWYDLNANEPDSKVYRAEAYHDWRVQDDPHGMPSLLRLHSLLLDAGPEGDLAQSALGKLNRGWPASDIATAYSVLRLNAPRDIRRTAPLTEGPSPWVLGLERRGPESSGSPVQEIREHGLSLEPLWFGWGMPKNAMPGGDRGYRSFGRIEGDFGDRVRGAADDEWISAGVHASWADAIARRTVTGEGRVMQAQDQTPVLIAGGFPNVHDDEILHQAYPPETAFTTVDWEPRRLGPGRHLDFGDAFRAAEGAPALAYAMQYVWAPAAMDVYLSAGHQGGLVGWINSDEAIRVHETHRPTGDDAVRGMGRLTAGWNRLLIKAESFTEERTIQFRLTGLDGLPIPGLRFADRPDSGAESGAR